MNINKIAEIIKEQGYEVAVQEIAKGSATKIGLTIGTGIVRPTIYPEQFTGTDEEIADKVIEFYEVNKVPTFDTEQLTDLGNLIVESYESKNNIQVSVQGVSAIVLKITWKVANKKKEGD